MFPGSPPLCRASAGLYKVENFRCLPEILQGGWPFPHRRGNPRVDARGYEVRERYENGYVSGYRISPPPPAMKLWTILIIFNA